MGDEVELDYQVLDRPPDEEQFHVKQQTIGKFYSSKRTLQSANLGYYTIEFSLEADDKTLDKIDKVVYQLSPSSKLDITKKDPKKHFEYVVTTNNRTPKITYTIYWKDKTLKPLRKEKPVDLKSGT